MDVFLPLQWFADWLTHRVLNLAEGSHFADALNFFVYDSLKILLLLIAINYVMAVVRYYLPVEKIRAFLAKRKWYGLGYFLAASFGAVTPFCSCSSIPFFVGFLGAGIPIGVTFSFLIASPLVNEAALVLLAGFFGWKLTLIYAASGIAIAIIGGMLLSKVNLQKHISQDILAFAGSVQTNDDSVGARFTKELWAVWWREALDFTKKLAPYIVVGVGIGAAIHGFVPQNFFATALGTGAWWSVPVATIVAVPLYSNAVGVIPIVQALVAKGVAVGTSFAFMMATVGLSLPEAFILKKVMSTSLLVRYFGIVTAGIMVIGFIINVTIG